MTPLLSIDPAVLELFSAQPPEHMAIAGAVGALAVAGLAALVARAFRARSKRVAPVAEPVTPAPRALAIPVIEYEDDDAIEPTRHGKKPEGVALGDVVFDASALNDEPTQQLPLFDVHASGQTDCGKRRKRNEDAILMLRGESVFAVADGMGGHAGGALASRLAVETIADTFLSRRFAVDTATKSRIPERAAELISAVGEAHDVVRRTAEMSDRHAEMGTTVVAARFCPRKRRLYVGSVGDSRCYRFRDGHLRQITTDHTMASLGAVGKAAQYLSRALGTQGKVEPDVRVLEPRVGDQYLLCSDGLTKMVKDQEIASVLEDAGDTDLAVRELVDLANERGGIDNVTAILLRVAPFEASSDSHVAL